MTAVAIAPVVWLATKGNGGDMTCPLVAIAVGLGLIVIGVVLLVRGSRERHS